MFSTGSIPAWSPGMKIIHCDASSDSVVVQTSDVGTSDYTVFSYILPANTLPVNGIISIHGGISLTGSQDMNLTLAFGSSNSSDGISVGVTSDASGGFAMFDVDIVAVGATAEKLCGRFVSGDVETTAIATARAAARTIAIDQTSDNAINIMTTYNMSAVTGTLTLNYMYIYYIPKYTT